MAEALRPPKLLLMGPPGSGKTYCIPTALKAGLKVAVLITEPGGQEALLDSLVAQGLDRDKAKLYWHYVAPTAQGFTALKNLAKQINMTSYADLANLKHGIDKPSQNQIMGLLNAMDHFVDDRTGADLGSVSAWGDDWLLAVDSLSGLNMLIMANTVGSKPAPAPGEWGTAMDFEEKLINKLAADLSCYFLLTAHVDRGVDEASQTTQIVPAALGSKLGPKIGRFFSEVVYARRVKEQFFWSTSEIMVATKNRALAISDTLAPNFAALVHAHEGRKKLAL